MIYFLIFVTIGALVLLTLFIGVVTTSMEEATEDMKASQEVEKTVVKITAEQNLSKEMIQMYRVVFAELDLDDGGTIEEQELMIGLKSTGRAFDEREMKDKFNEVGGRGGGLDPDPDPDPDADPYPDPRSDPDLPLPLILTPTLTLALVRSMRTSQARSTSLSSSRSCSESKRAR